MHKLFRIIEVGEDKNYVSMLCSSVECKHLVNFGNKSLRTLSWYCKIH